MFRKHPWTAAACVTLMAACFLVLAPAPARAWGQRAHAVIDRAAIAGLPPDGPVFLRRYADYVALSATIPDFWRAASEPFSKIEEDPNHGWFREQFAFLRPIPRSRYEFVLALHDQYLRIKSRDRDAAQRMNVRWTGTLPYAAMEAYGRLVATMRRLRRAPDGSIEAQFLEQACAFQVFQMGHYVGDGAQPLHDTIHHDGWSGANPAGYTRDPAIHGRVESKFVDEIGLTEADISGRLGAAGHLDGDLFEMVLAYLDEAGDLTERIYQLDQRGAFGNPGDSEARELVYQRTAAGAAMLRDMIHRAWLESALAPAAELANPVDVANPAYNPATGSAPANRSPPVR